MAIIKKKMEFKTWHVILVLALLALSIGGRFYAGYWPKTTLKIAGQELRVLLADTDEHRHKGWGGAKDMKKYGGMLFVFPNRGSHAMVMRDMNFPLDIVWIDNGEIVDMAPNLPPEKGYTEEQLTPYFARLPSTLVLELPAGFISENGLSIGDTVEIIK